MFSRVTANPYNLEEALAAKNLFAQIPIDILDGTSLKKFNQMRHNLQVYVDAYTQQIHYDETQIIIDEIGTLEKKQDVAINRIIKLGHILDEIKDIATTTQGQQVSMDEKLILLQQRFAEHGLNIDESFLFIVHQHELFAENLSQVLGYLEEERQFKYEQAKQQELMAKYQGLSDASQLLIAAGDVSGNKTIGIIGRVAFYTVAIAQASQALFNQSVSGLALLTPYSAIAMAALQLFSLFRSNNTEDMNQFILKQLALLSHQIHTLHHELKTEFTDLNRKIDHYFFSLTRQIQWLEQTLLLSMHQQLSMLSQEMHQLRMITIAGFRDLLLEDLQKLLSHHNDLVNGISSTTIIKTIDAENMLRKLRDYACLISRNQLFTGTLYKNLLESPTLITLSRLNETLVEHRESPQNIIGLIFLHAKHVLQLQQLRSINDNAMFNMAIFSTSVSTYVSLKNMLSDIVLYDSNKINELSFITFAENMINFLLCLQQEKLIYQQLFSKIDEYIDRINIVSTHLVSTYSKDHAISILLSFSDLLNTYNGKHPHNYHFQPFEVDPDLSGRQENRDFFKIENITKIIKIFTIPAIFILAEDLKLGQFECRFVDPSNINKKRRTSETNPNKYTLKPCRYGMDIRFVFKSGTAFSIYSASKMSGEKKFGPSRDLYAYAIKFGTKPHFDETMISHVTTLVAQEWLSMRKELALSISNQISLTYTNLVNQLCWLQLYSALAHFPKHLTVSIDALYGQLTSAMGYHTYTQAAKVESDFPAIPLLTLTQLSGDIETWIETIGSNNLHNPLVCQLEIELRPSRERCLLQEAIEVDTNKTDVALSSVDTAFSKRARSTTSTTTTIIEPHLTAKL